MARRRHVDLYQDRAGRWRFRLVAANGEKQTASQRYSRKDAAKRGAERAHPGIEIRDAA